MDTLISGATVVTMNEGMEVLLGGFVGITDGKIVYLSKEAPKEKPAAIVDGSGMVLLPGLINCHTHLAQTALRNFFDDLSPKDSLEALLRFEARMDSKAAEAAVTMGVAECLRMGITSVSDLYYYPEATAKVLDKAGMKGNLALSAYRFEDQNEDFDFESDPQCQELRRLVEKWHGHDQGRIRMDAGIYAEYTSNYRLWEGMGGLRPGKGPGLPAAPFSDGIRAGGLSGPDGSGPCGAAELPRGIQQQDLRRGLRVSHRPRDHSAGQKARFCRTDPGGRRFEGPQDRRCGHAAESGHERGPGQRRCGAGRQRGPL